MQFILAIMAISWLVDILISLPDQWTYRGVVHTSSFAYSMITLYALVAYWLIRDRIKNTRLAAYAGVYGEWLQSLNDATQDSGALRSRLDRYFDDNTGWPYTVPDSPRTIFLLLVVQSVVWPVDAVVRSLYHTIKWMSGFTVLKTLRAVITYKE